MVRHTRRKRGGALGKWISRANAFVKANKLVSKGARMLNKKYVSKKYRPFVHRAINMASSKTGYGFRLTGSGSGLTGSGRRVRRR